MTATVKALTVEAGADWRLDFAFHVENADGTAGAVVPLTGYTLTLEVRDNTSTSSDPALWTASSEPQDDIDPEFTINGPAGTASLHADATRTLQLPQTSWTKTQEDDPKHHYTLRAINPAGEDTFVITGPLSINVA